MKTDYSFHACKMVCGNDKFTATKELIIYGQQMNNLLQLLRCGIYDELLMGDNAIQDNCYFQRAPISRMANTIRRIDDIREELSKIRQIGTCLGIIYCEPCGCNVTAKMRIICNTPLINYFCRMINLSPKDYLTLISCGLVVSFVSLPFTV